MKTLITGGAGFLGSHLVEYLLSRGEQIIVLDNYSSGKVQNLNFLKDSDLVEIVEGSILDQGLVDKLMATVEHCFHLSAALGVKRINDDPIKSLQTNIQGTATVLDAASKFNVKTVLASSSEIYGRNPIMPLTEESDRVLGSPKIPRWSYSEAKALNELYAFHLNKHSNYKVVVARLFNTVGVRQDSEYGMVLPKFVKSALENKSLLVYGNGTQTRSFCSVSDVIIALDKLMNNARCVGQAFNIGSGNEIAIQDLANLVIKLTESKSTVLLKSYKEVFGDNFEEPIRRVPDISKIIKATGWYPKKSLEDIITEIAEYTKNVF